MERIDASRIGIHFMCGICGILNFDRSRPLQRSWLEGMNRQIVHRGPDDDGYFLSDNVGLAVRRLSIIDLQTGKQPIGNEDNGIRIVHNGEVYNYKELRKELLQKGHQFRTHSDTETVVHAYEEYGRECVQQLRGMFAFAVWDVKRRRLFVARDRLGIKPLYYRLTEREFVFASEIKSILEYPGTKREFNRFVLPEYLAFGYTAGSDTFFEGIHSLPPGHWLEVDESGGVSIQQYWDLSSRPDAKEHPQPYYVDGYRELLEKCVASHLMSDVPLGMFLSGGLDSSAVAALATKIRGEPLETFSVGYDEVRYSELSYAREVAEHIGSQHHEVLMRREDFFNVLPVVIWHEDKPLTWPSSVSLYLLAKAASERVRVVLTGEGSDETLAGYSRYAFTAINASLHSVYRASTPPALRRAIRTVIHDTQWLGAKLRRKLEHTFLGRDGESFNSIYLDNFLCAFSQKEQKQLLADHKVNPASAYQNTLAFWKKSSGDTISRLLYTDIKTYLVELLMKQDRMSMAASIESRVPFLDHVLVEFATCIPSRYKIRGRSGKHVLKAAMVDLLPEHIIGRKKMGFPTPWQAWLAGPQLPWIEALLMDARTRARGLFKGEEVGCILSEHKAGKRDHADRIWRLVNLELWQRVVIEQDP